MNTTQVHDIIKCLADGFDPLTGEVLPDHSCLHKGDVIRALIRATQILEKVGADELRRQKRPQNVGRPWSDEEETRLLGAFDQGVSVTDIAAEHGRSKGAITARLVRHGRLEEQ